ncbi:V-type proton ATPase subunit C-like isoform X2 [Malania oleifera]|uniref:V-type proton ATPase subunit C-like isoform X2 n=1 Tax=Malania oleifera TaxID=397392 RepID=UPI0025ADE547|nr:V-type proton ATPase subunit C-like isoform X2 [Malania oleifera]
MRRLVGIDNCPARPGPAQNFGGLNTRHRQCASWSLGVLSLQPVFNASFELEVAMAATTRYLVVSLPVQTSVSSLWNRLQEAICKCSFETTLYRFVIPDLRVGTLDTLLSLSDDLFKSNRFVEGVSHKIRLQIDELERASGVDGGALTVDGVPVDSYLTRFVWDEAKYPTMSPLRVVFDSILAQVVRIDDSLKVRVGEYNIVGNQLNAIIRQQSGSLAVRDLSSLLKPEDIVTSEHLVTLLAIIPKYSQEDWLLNYETLTDYVVPRSSKKLQEDNEYALYKVTLFRHVAGGFKMGAREKGFQIRDFEYSPEAQESHKQELERLTRDRDQLKSSLVQWCHASYGEIFSYWMHFCAIRVFVESILRYGLPPSFVACLLAPSMKSEKKVHAILEGLCNSVHRHWKCEDENGGIAGLGGDLDAYPYVCFPINLI